MKLNLYRYCPTNQYSFGSVLIAAESLQDAERFLPDYPPLEFEGELGGVYADEPARLIYDDSGIE
jgi:hypothetical protein